MFGIGKRCKGCAYCIHADRAKMKCFPKSKDCESEYDLEESDFHTECNCDFFEERRMVKLK